MPIQHWTQRPAASPVIKNFESKTSADETSRPRDTHDRVTFQNGGSVEELDARSAFVKLNGPDGSSQQLLGWIGQEFDSEEPVVKFTVKDDSGDRTDWEQSFPAEGGTVLRRETDLPMEDLLIKVAADGTVTGKYEEFGPTVEAKRDGGSLIFTDWQTESVTPAVPLEWVIGQ